MNKLDKKLLKSIIAEALDIPVNSVTDESEEGKIEEWDSLGQLSILTSLDSKIDTDISTISELGKANSVKQIEKILNDYGIMK
tara:strand:+ start:265 stop:513 length:249 start_codon:yes stop_codon:yes gene_type:complete